MQGAVESDHTILNHPVRAHLVRTLRLVKKPAGNPVKSIPAFQPVKKITPENLYNK